MRFYRIIAVTLALFGGIGGHVSAFAQQATTDAASPVYRVTNISVDKTAGNAADAREEALIEGQKKAWDVLIHRLTTAEKTPVLDDAQLGKLVHGVEVQNERTSGVRYVGTLTFTFTPTYVRAFLRNAKIPYADNQHKPVLVLPVTRLDSGLTLWQERTAWRTAWENAASDAGLVPLIVPFGDLSDVADIAADEAFAGQADPIRRIGSRYQAESVIVAIMSEKGGDKTSSALEATFALYPLEGPSKAYEVKSALSAGTETAHFASIIETAMKTMENDWKNNNIVDPAIENSLDIHAVAPTLEAMSSLRMTLSKLPLVSKVAIIALRQGDADLRLTYNGTPEHLVDVLRQHGFILNPPAPEDTIDTPTPAIDSPTPLPDAAPLPSKPWELRLVAVAAPSPAEDPSVAHVALESAPETADENHDSVSPENDAPLPPPNYGPLTPPTGANEDDDPMARGSTAPAMPQAIALPAPVSPDASATTPAPQGTEPQAHQESSPLPQEETGNSTTEKDLSAETPSPEKAP